MKFLVVAAVVGSFLFLLKKLLFTNANIGITEKSIDVLALKDVVEFFKQDLVLEKLNDNDALSAVAIIDKNTVTCTLFDKTKKEVVDIKDCAIRFVFKEMAEDLKATFGDKKMVVLK